jgi:predicted nucleic acid-binding protein
LRISTAFQNIHRLCIETAPLIYYVEANPVYSSKFDAILDVVESNAVSVVSSVVTLTEILALPLRLNQSRYVREYREILVHSGQFQLVEVTRPIAELGAELRANYHLRTVDALHVATAIEAGCDAFLTNDKVLKRVTEIVVLVMDDLETDGTV